MPIMRRRPFVLLEFLIALSLVGLLSVYLIHSPIKALSWEYKQLIDLEAKRLCLLKVMEIRKELPEKAPFSKTWSEWVPFDLEISFQPKDQKEGKKGKLIRMKYHYQLKTEESDANGTRYSRVQVEICPNTDSKKGKDKDREKIIDQEKVSYDFFLITS